MSFRFVSEADRVRFRNDAQKADDGNSIDSRESARRIRHFTYSSLKSTEQQMFDWPIRTLLQLHGHARGSRHKSPNS
jgi:hypothetical protein